MVAPELYVVDRIIRYQEKAKKAFALVIIFVTVGVQKYQGRLTWTPLSSQTHRMVFIQEQSKGSIS